MGRRRRPESTAKAWCGRERLDHRDAYVAVARLLIESGADPDHFCNKRSARTMAYEMMCTLMDERKRAVTTASVAASLMSGLCGEHSGSLLASFLATPWILSRIQPKPEFVAIGVNLRG